MVKTAQRAKKCWNTRVVLFVRMRKAGPEEAAYGQKENGASLKQQTRTKE
jgi:hypothetical protein